MILIIDHYDSFTYNLSHEFGKLGKEVTVKRHDELSIEAINTMKPEYIILSSGPGRPEKHGLTCKVIRLFSGRIPILGIGLGCHAVAEAFGGDIEMTENLRPGKPTEIFHDGKAVFTGIGQPFTATRYHSLSVSKESMPDCLKISAWNSEKEIMAIRHTKFAVEGLQFNPESIMTEAGEKLLSNFIELNGWQ